ncbi:hypothetical protein CEUSTIGMA_g4677.t1 [Chlamydomonas eustigma]|uniref:SOUL heme-binding protein n=1 Tax=Chlamydomonas eustigma TaxID=1157962 RepID=A0A250X2D6_9CHLO|nr:hypothetical protein CEUSTIGMA_g4677.t1 [Chlamydomonas eustigma]|eukprot:GAX77231.1 hypothetical protein CEUSTIGMA_g4677.t1 [Chlamydomonas eustigma]
MATIFGAITSETPKYDLVKKLAVYEVRKYGRQVRAEVKVETSGHMMENLGVPFRMLAGYIFGGNIKSLGTAGASVITEPSKQPGAASNEKVAMTAPVLLSQQVPTGVKADNEKVAMTAPVLLNEHQADKKSVKMSFIMPSIYDSVDKLPIPKDARVHLVEVPEHKVAVIRFSGQFSAARAAYFKDREAALRAAAKEDGIVLSVDPQDVVVAGYNPPWCLPWLRTNEIMIPVLEGAS